jgi:hypothetical protein
MTTTKNLKVGTIIQTSIDGVNFKDTIITKVSEKFVWFKGSGYNRIAKQTFINYPCFYKIK